MATRARKKQSPFREEIEKFDARIGLRGVSSGELSEGLKHQKFPREASGFVYYGRKPPRVGVDVKRFIENAQNITKEIAVYAIRDHFFKSLEKELFKKHITIQDSQVQEEAYRKLKSLLSSRESSKVIHKFLPTIFAFDHESRRGKEFAFDKGFENEFFAEGIPPDTAFFRKEGGEKTSPRKEVNEGRKETQNKARLLFFGRITPSEFKEILEEAGGSMMPLRQLERLLTKRLERNFYKSFRNYIRKSRGK